MTQEQTAREDTNMRENRSPLQDEYLSDMRAAFSSPYKPNFCICRQGDIRRLLGWRQKKVVQKVDNEVFLLVLSHCYIYSAAN